MALVSRRKAIPVRVGSVVIGGAAPIAVQTMTKTDTRDVRATVRQIHELKEAGCEIVRPAVPDREAAEALREIVKQSPLPVIADIHYDHTLALLAIEAGVHCLRLNPGNIPDREKVVKVVMAAKERQIPFRIGVNAGSLPEEVHKSLREQHHIDRDDRERTAERMVEVALGHCKILEELDYGPGFIKVSLKATDVWTNILANRKFAAARQYPIHLGVTESGPVEAGSIRSAVGMGILLSEGIGDTIRVSLATSDPREEVRVAHEILKTLAFRKESPTLITCPLAGEVGGRRPPGGGAGLAGKGHHNQHGSSRHETGNRREAGLRERSHQDVRRLRPLVHGRGPQGRAGRLVRRARDDGRAA